MSFDADSAGNAQEIEMQFAVKTVEHLEAYQNILLSIPPSKIKLTPIDDELLAHFLDTFPEYKFDDALRNLDEDKMKTAAGKERWRSFIMPYEGKLNEYNFGTLVRKDAEKPYAEDNTILVTRVQFFGIEIARNRAGINDKFYNDSQAAKAKNMQIYQPEQVISSPPQETVVRSLNHASMRPTFMLRHPHRFMGGEEGKHGYGVMAEHVHQKEKGMAYICVFSLLMETFAASVSSLGAYESNTHPAWPEALSSSEKTRGQNIPRWY